MNKLLSGWLIMLTIGVIIAMLLPFLLDLIKKHKEDENIWS